MMHIITKYGGITQNPMLEIPHHYIIYELYSLIILIDVTFYYSPWRINSCIHCMSSIFF